MTQAKQFGLARIRCVVSRGMFDNEYAVEINVPGGTPISLFVDRSLVYVDPVNDEATLQVTSVASGSPEGETDVLLPSEAFESGSRWIRLPAHEVRPPRPHRDAPACPGEPP